MNAKTRCISTVADTNNGTNLSSFLLKNDLLESLYCNHTEPSNLIPFQRILLTTDGTVTDILGAKKIIEFLFGIAV
ncbi:hypothetical protein HC931_23375 [Candidatus Gracilibacteria bacterium]|nr:hypothetical protein [Candidatus Gracilibacteria bacterium]NJM86164.1 hypothetical protein [Hydrococcus sp. RU_2_2]NJP19134.1 hypothetical protein [Hydrococcus sp. CRU_1_1]